MEIPVQLTVSRKTIFTTAMLNSRAAGNLIDIDFGEQNDMLVTSCASPLSVAALDGVPLGSSYVCYVSKFNASGWSPAHSDTVG